ncbi:MAG: hypothetical protein ACI9FU_001517 [Granulosicoccus sp.]
MARGQKQNWKNEQEDVPVGHRPIVYRVSKLRLMRQ